MFFFRRDMLEGCLNSTTHDCGYIAQMAISRVAHGLVMLKGDMSQSNDSNPRDGRPGDRDDDGNPRDNKPGDKDDDGNPRDDKPGDKDDDDKRRGDRGSMSMPYTMEKVEKYYGNSTCVCDPALAVHCIFEVNHLSKQDDPDWEGLCP